MFDTTTPCILTNTMNPVEMSWAIKIPINLNSEKATPANEISDNN